MGTSSPDFIQTPQPDGSELAAKVVSLLSITVLSVLFGIKTYNVQFKYLTYSRWLVLALYVLSWAFTTISMLLVTTNNANFTSCFLSIMVCDVFYSGTKLVIYAWLIEKVYVVSSTRQTRWRTMSYRIHVLLMVPYIAILTLMLIFHTADLEDSGVCIIGLQSVAAIPLIAYDFAINLYMTIFFVRPLLKLGKSKDVLDRQQSRLHHVALRTLVASVVCLIVSFANIFSLQMFHGRERGLVCLACCTVDVTINVVTIHWVTSQATIRRGRDISHMEFSTNQNNSNPNHSMHHNHSFHRKLNDLDLDEQITRFDANTPITELYGFTDHTKSTPRNDSKITTVDKCDDGESSESAFCASSLHESQSSRKSLTKK
ncbi:hypothetical protein [Parasitella parasitica]|uniref:G-protein coupled receptors family 1 profile domain-containing protein n=1 Tax=Parasitella parasitica TaxID=35722 RepID=A0A0B7MZA4_9FUNG|nr:hypothetical protein [Parasitella parasitica]